MEVFIMEELKNELVLIYKKYFMTSGYRVHDYTNFFGSNKKEFTIALYLAKDTTEVANGIIDNDMLSVLFNIEETGVNNYEIRSISKSYVIKPETSYLYYGRRHLQFRKTTGDADKIKKTFEKFIYNLKESITEDYKDNIIHDNFTELVKEKLGL